jgi:galactokinase
MIGTTVPGLEGFPPSPALASAAVLDRRSRVHAVVETVGPTARVWRAPGRVNLIGDHTDYQDGLCLPIAIDREVDVAYRPRGDGRVIVRSLDLGGTVEVDAGGADDPESVTPPWGRTVAGVVRVLTSRGRGPVGIDAAVASSIPIGSGLSSSAAFEVALAGALADAAEWPLSGVELAAAAQEAEPLGTGMPCGIMDQLASVAGRADHALLIDCRSLEVEAIALPDSLGIIVVHSGLPRALETSAYAQRRAACEATAARLGLDSLRDATAAQVADDPRARHVVSENQRVVDFVRNVRAGDLAALGRVALASHRSLADDFAVSTPELDLLVSLAVDCGAYGARLTGAGFGGCIVTLVPAAESEQMVASVVDRYRAETGLEAVSFAVHAVAGAGPLVVD